MTRFVSFLALGLAALVLPFAGDARAQDCACLVPVAEMSADAGAIIEARGDVRILHATGIAEAGQGSPLAIGSRVIVGEQSAASIRVGANCSLKLGARSSAALALSENRICVSVQDMTTTAATDGAFSIGLPEKIFGGLAAGAGFGAALDDGDAVSD